MLTLWYLPSALQWSIVSLTSERVLAWLSTKGYRLFKLWALNSRRVSFSKIWNVSHHEDYPVQLLISESRLGKTRDDTFKVMQKERHTYSFDSQKRKPLNISHTGALWPRTTANQVLALCFASEAHHLQLAWRLERKPTDTLFWLWGTPGANMNKSQSGSAKPEKNRV